MVVALVGLPCNVTRGSGMTCHSPVSNTLQCGRWFWNNMPLDLPKRPPYLKTPCTTSYRSSIDTIALNCLVFLENCILATDRQTNKQTNRWTGLMHEAALDVASGGLKIQRWMAAISEIIKSPCYNEKNHQILNKFGTQ